jgi:hypothetical protein
MAFIFSFCKDSNHDEDMGKPSDKANEGSDGHSQATPSKLGVQPFAGIDESDDHGHALKTHSDKNSRFAVHLGFSPDFL